MHCPFRNFEECPEHNKKGGCSFWMAYASSREGLDAHMDGCAITLTPLLLLELANNLGAVAGEVSKVGAEVSAGRNENIRNGEATRRQFLALAQGTLQLVTPDYSGINALEGGTTCDRQ